MELNTYLKHLKTKGNNLAEVKKNQSDFIIDRTFKRDPNYKKVYILTRDGWKFEDAKYQVHSTPSILKDAVDYYLQFHTKVHYPIGTYVIIPDDTDYSINLTKEQLEDPWSQPVEDRTQWWFIVGMDEARSYVRYNVLKCNFELKWLWKDQIMRCFCSVRDSKSYTSGVWRGDYSISLDNVFGVWMPDVVQIYGAENISKLGLYNNQTLLHDQRLMITGNELYPQCYKISKITELLPTGVIKLTLKQDEFNERRDNPQLEICDYFTDQGNPIIKIDPKPVTGEYTSSISYMTVNEDGELIELTEDLGKLWRGKISYFAADFFIDGEPTQVDPEWKIIMLNDEDYDQDDLDYYVGLIDISEFDDAVVGIKPAKAGSLSGKNFRLTVADVDGNYYSSVDLEVI